MTIGCITCTGDRPEAFALCERWMRSQIRPPNQWIVVDDGHEPTRCRMDQTVIRLPPSDGHTLRRNLLAGLPLLRTDLVAFIEDDDFYATFWLDLMRDFMMTPSRQRWALPHVAGEAAAIYYNVKLRKWMRWGNINHASLAMTVVRRDALDAIIKRAIDVDDDGTDDTKPQLIDWRIWAMPELFRSLRLHSSIERPGVVGMKGMPGRFGMASFHRKDDMDCATDDADMAFLKRAIGEHAEVYAKFYEAVDNG